MNTERVYDVFVSYSSKDHAKVLPIAEQLRERGLSVWIDEWCIQPGDHIGLKIQEGLESSRCIVFFMSPHYFRSEWGLIEVHSYIFKGPSNAARKFIPILIEECQLPSLLAPFKYLDWSEIDTYGCDDLMRIISTADNTRRTDGLPKPLSLSDNVIVDTHHKARISSVDISEAWAITGFEDGVIKLWDVSQPRAVASIPGHKGQVKFTRLLSRNGMFLSASERDIKVWSLASRESHVNLHIEGIYRVSVSDTGTIVVRSQRGVEIYSATSGKKIDVKYGSYSDAIIDRSGRYVLAVRDSSLGGALAMGFFLFTKFNPFNEGAVDLWDLESGEEKVLRWSLGDRFPNTLSLFGDDKKIVTYSSKFREGVLQKSIYITSITTGEKISEVRVADSCAGVDYSSTSNVVVMNHYDGYITIRRLESLDVVDKIKVFEKATSKLMGLSSDGTRLISATGSAMILSNISP